LPVFHGRDAHATPLFEQECSDKAARKSGAVIRA